MRQNYIQMLKKAINDRHFLDLSPVEMRKVLEGLSIKYPAGTYYHIRTAFRLEIEMFVTQGLISDELAHQYITDLPKPQNILPAGEPYHNLNVVADKLRNGKPKEQAAFALLLTGATGADIASISSVERQDGLYVMMNDKIYYSPVRALYRVRFKTKHGLYSQFRKYKLSFPRARRTVFEMLATKLNNQTINYWYHLGQNYTDRNVLSWEETKPIIDKLFQRFYS